MPARSRDRARPVDSQALALNIFASLSGAILSSALGADELGSLLCAAIAPALTAIVMHPGPHRRRRLALVAALLALLRLAQAALARVRGRQVRAKVARAGGLRFAGLTASLAFAISVALLTAPELVLGDAFVSDRRLTLIPVGEPERPPGPRPVPTPTPTAATPDPTPTATPRVSKPPPVETTVPDRSVPDGRALDPHGPPPDRTAPELDLPAGIAARANDRRGAVVRYRVRAVDGIDGSVTPSCRPASGSRFPVGATTVHCTARDRAGNTITGSFKVRVSPPPVVTETPAPPTPTPSPPKETPEPDPEPPQPEPDKAPVFTGPSDIIGETGRRPGTLVDYPTPPATDDHDPDVAVTCDPPRVAAGKSANVTCRATDDAGLSTQQAFVVTIKIVR